MATDYDNIWFTNTYKHQAIAFTRSHASSFHNRFAGALILPDIIAERLEHVTFSPSGMTFEDFTGFLSKFTGLKTLTILSEARCCRRYVKGGYTKPILPPEVNDQL